MEKIQITSWLTDKLLYECDIPEELRDAGRPKQLGYAVQKAVSEGVSLARANLYSANLYMANLDGANLYRANLFGAILEGANLEGANIACANLEGANLTNTTLGKGE